MLEIELLDLVELVDLQLLAAGEQGSVLGAGQSMLTPIRFMWYLQLTG